jgi:multicomponent K+:H+ antiporter subunit C
MEAILAIGIGGMVTAGVYLVLRARTFPVILGLSLLSYAVNLLIAVSGRVTVNEWPITDGTSPAYPDPLPQALVLTAIVIGFAMTAFVLVLSLRARYELGTDHVDGARDEP